MFAARTIAMIIAASVLLTGCGTPSPAPLVMRPPDSRFVATLPDGPLPPLAEPTDSAKLVNAAIATNDPTVTLSTWEKAAASGSPAGRYGLARLLADWIAGPERRGDGLDIMLDLARQGHGQAALFLWQLSSRSRSANLNQHAPYWLNIARRAGDQTANEIYAKLLSDERAKGTLPPSTGTGDYFDSAIIFTHPISSGQEGVLLEYKVAALLYPDWKRIAQSVVQSNGKVFDVLVLENVEGQQVKLYVDVTAWNGLPKR